MMSEWEMKDNYRWYHYLWTILVSPLLILAWPFIQPKFGMKYGDEHDE